MKYHLNIGNTIIDKKKSMVKSFIKDEHAFLSLFVQDLCERNCC